MAFTELETKRIEKTVKGYVERRRPPLHVRPQLDTGFRVTGQSVEIFEIRPAWRDPGTLLEHPVARATFIRKQAVWKVFWRRADSKWHGYTPAPTVETIEEFLELLEADQHACFWG